MTLRDFIDLIECTEDEGASPDSQVLISERRTDPREVEDIVYDPEIDKVVIY